MKKILCFGDSNTFGYDPRSFGGGRYPKEVRWTGLLSSAPDWEVLNRGENGREIPTREGELRQAEKSLLRGGDLDCLRIIMLGTNDLLQHSDFLAETVTTRMEEFLGRLLSLPGLSGDRLLLLAPPPLKPGVWVTEERPLLESARLGACYGALARTLGIGFLDTGLWKISLAFDGVHFSPEGHQFFAQRLSEALRHHSQ